MTAKRLSIKITALAAVFSVLPISAKKSKPLNDLQVEVMAVQSSWTGYATVGQGHGNVTEAFQRHGFDFVFSCTGGFMASNVGMYYPARWKKPGSRLIIEESEIGRPEKKTYCELRTTLMPYTYEPNFTPLRTAPTLR